MIGTYAKPMFKMQETADELEAIRHHFHNDPKAKQAVQEAINALRGSAEQLRSAEHEHSNEPNPLTTRCNMIGTTYRLEWIQDGNARSEEWTAEGTARQRFEAIKKIQGVTEIEFSQIRTRVNSTSREGIDYWSPTTADPPNIPPEMI